MDNGHHHKPSEKVNAMAGLEGKVTARMANDLYPT